MCFSKKLSIKKQFLIEGAVKTGKLGFEINEALLSSNCSCYVVETLGKRYYFLIEISCKGYYYFEIPKNLFNDIIASLPL